MCWALIFAGVSAGLGAYANIQQGQATQMANEFNAQIAERNAQAVEDERKNVEDAGAIERRRLGEKVRAERGELYAKYGAMGLDAQFGTPADLIGDIERSYRIDRDILGRNETNALRQLDLQEADYRDSAKLLRAAGKSAVQAGSYAAAGSLLNGASTVADKWIKPSTSTVPVGGD